MTRGGEDAVTRGRGEITVSPCLPLAMMIELEELEEALARARMEEER